MSDVLRVLVVEDDEVDQIRIRHVFRDQNEYQFVESRSLADARQALKIQHFDCVILDLGLPDGSGLKFLAELASLPVVVLTGHDQDAMRRVALSAGAQDYINKDEIRTHALSRAIQHAIERKEVEALKLRLVTNERLASLGRIAASVAHEINNPNAYVAANLHLLKEDARRWNTFLQALNKRAEVDAALAQILREHEASGFGDDVEDLVEDCIDGIRRITALVRQMQTFSRQDLTEPLAEVNLNTVVTRSASILGLQNVAGVDCTFNLSADLPPCIVRDSQLIQVVTNLLGNALHAVRDVEKPQLIVTTTLNRTPAPSVSVTVDDNGPGIPETMIRKVFEPFFSTKSVGEGTGLGLSIAQEIVEQHQGTLTLADSPVGGLRARVEIPLGLHFERKQDADGASAPDVDVGESWRILVIDDEPSVLRAMRRLLAPHNAICASGVEADQLLRVDQDFDAIICDLMMPEVDGVAVFETIEARSPDLARKVIFHTGGAVSLRATALLARAKNPVLEKPVFRNEILKTVAAVVMAHPDSGRMTDVLD